MSCFDVFNGDADGICALLQLRLDQPLTSTLITGVKRDIALLGRVEAEAGDTVTVLDISLDKNREALVRLLEDGVKTRYFDHHFPGEIPEHPNLEVHIDTAPTTCTSLLVDQALAGRYRAWAVVAAFGDNLYDSAREAARPLDLDETQLEKLRLLGTCINYNGYGSELADLHFHPDELYRRLLPYPDPLDFIHNDPAYIQLLEGYNSDMALAHELRPEIETPGGSIYVLPDAAWARRVSGVFANELAQRYPHRAHALLTRRADGDFVVSVRAPLDKPEGADTLCRSFPTGGGRKAAAGINRLPADDFEAFVQRFQETYG